MAASASGSASDSGACAGTECCAPSGAPVRLARAEADRLAARFKALGDPNRLLILSIVAAADGQEACVCDITEPLDLGQPTVSHHLRVLVQAGFLSREKRGVWAYYSLVPGSLDALAGPELGLRG
ncbi:ArsR/SmtB family transcription factor [Zafaria sp. J156]|uniref:ArsR/SmtB family transcription factor n=1 Tax=Zafaria sp. J156 TaxID=3116490 RepID=UPI003D35A551